MKKKMLTAFLATILISIIGIFVMKSPDSKVSGQTTLTTEENINSDGPKTLPASSDRFPDQVFFDMLFNTVLSMEKAAANLRSDGKSADIWEDYFERRASLTKLQASELRKVTAEFEREISPIQIRAVQVISERRAARARGETTSPVSEELHSLQSKRDAISIRYGNDLQRRLGLPVVDKLREVMKQTASDSPKIADADRLNLTEKLRQFRDKTNALSRSGTQGGQKQ